MDGIVLTHSDIKDGELGRSVRFRFERPSASGFDFAEGILPERTILKSYGFSEDELLAFDSYLRDNLFLIWEYAQKGGGLNA
jgi:hypothetical protein